MTMQPVHVQRFAGRSPWAGSVTPEDRSWTVFVDQSGEATFWRRVPADCAPRSIGEDLTKVEHAYVDAELPGVAFPEGGTPPVPHRVQVDHLGPLDYEVRPGREPFGDCLDAAAHAAEAVAHPEARDGYYATLNARAVSCWGETEHEAVRSLLNYVVELCVAGSLDHTGAPLLGNPRRRAAVFPADRDQ